MEYSSHCETVAQLVNKFPVFYEIRMFITVFTRTSSPVSVLSQANPVHNLQPYCPQIHFNIIFRPTSRSSGVPAKIVYYFSTSYARYMPRLSHP
jgi:hypothetical protein